MYESETTSEFTDERSGAASPLMLSWLKLDSDLTMGLAAASSGSHARAATLFMIVEENVLVCDVM